MFIKHKVIIPMS